MSYACRALSESKPEAQIELSANGTGHLMRPGRAKDEFSEAGTVGYLVHPGFCFAKRGFNRIQ